MCIPQIGTWCREFKLEEEMLEMLAQPMKDLSILGSKIFLLALADGRSSSSYP